MVFIGASHIARTVSQADETAIYLLPKWRSVGDVADLLALNKDDSVVVDLLGNSCFMGSKSKGIPAERYNVTFKCTLLQIKKNNF